MSRVLTPAVVRQRPTPRWMISEPGDAARIGALEQALQLPRVVCELLVARGFVAPDDARRYLRPRLDQLHAPTAMRGMDGAVDRLVRAGKNGESVLVHGDYDVDGICSLTILVRTLRRIGVRAVPFIPHRVTDGYDLGPAGVRAAVAEGVKVVVTCDCGTSAHDAVADLTAAGIDVIISDHHLPGSAPPRALAVLNPRLPESNYPDPDLCAAGVAFKLAVALLEATGQSTTPALRMLDLVALATIADVAPLRGENRIFVRYGLKLMAETDHIGLRALLQSSGLDAKAITTGRISFTLAPRLNAVGRLGHALRGVELLLSDNAEHANGIARELEELNRTRQEMDRETLQDARAMLERDGGDPPVGIVLASEKWHPGVIGIVASRLVEEYYRPVVLVAVEAGVGKGSGRSIGPFDLHGGIAACSHTLQRFGGHRMAAGITIDAEKIPEFAAGFDAVARERLSSDDLVPNLRVDLVLPAREASPDLEKLLRHFEPFGIGNPGPVLATIAARQRGVPRTVGQNGLRFRVENGAEGLDAIWWGGADRAGDLPSGAPFDVAYRLEQDTYFVPPRLTARVVDVRV